MIDVDIWLLSTKMALNYETLMHAANKPPEQRTTTEINDFIFPWLKQSLKKKQGIFQKISDGRICSSLTKTNYQLLKMWFTISVRRLWSNDGRHGTLWFIKVTLETRKLSLTKMPISYVRTRFYIILQGSVNIYRFDEDGPKPAALEFDTVKEFARLNDDPEKREELIAEAFGNFVVTLGKRSTRERWLSVRYTGRKNHLFRRKRSCLQTT